MWSETTQVSLLDRLRESADQLAWRQFDQKYRELILRYCRARGLRLADAEDVHQNVLLDLARAMPHFSYQPERGRFRSYLGRVVRNAIARYFGRHARLEYGLDTKVLAIVPSTTPDDGDQRWEEEWIRNHYRLALRKLRESTEPRGIAVFERLLAGESTAQIARTCDMHEPAVRKIKQRIRERLQAIIADQLRAEDRLGERD